MKVLALIPARGGSKGIPRKNLVDLGGIPLIAWSIRAAQQVLEIDRIVVSTDDEEIRDVSLQWGADVPFLRPEEISGDRANLKNALEHTISELAREGEHYDVVLLLYPTHPFRTPELLREVIQISKTRAFSCSIVSTRSVNLSEWYGERLGYWYPVFTEPQGKKVTLSKSLGLVIASSNLPENVIGTKGLNYYKKALGHIQSGDQRFIFGTEYISATHAPMLIDIDSYEDLALARSVVESNALPWAPLECEGQMEAPQAIVLNGNAILAPAIENIEYFVVEYDLNRRRCAAEPMKIHINTGLTPIELRALLDDSAISSGKDVLVYRYVDQIQQLPFFDTEHPQLELDEEDIFPACSQILYSQIDYSVVPISAEFTAALNPQPLLHESGGGRENEVTKVCGSTRALLQDGMLCFELNDAPQSGDQLIVRLFKTDDEEEVYCCSLLCKDGKWSENQKSDIYVYSKNLPVNCDGNLISFTVPPGAPVASMLWIRPIRDLTTRTQQSEGFTLDGWVTFERSKGWINTLTGELITGRQDLPRIYRWTGLAFLPANIGNCDSWTRMSNDKRKEQ